MFANPSIIHAPELFQHPQPNPVYRGALSRKFRVVVYVVLTIGDRENLAGTVGCCERASLSLANLRFHTVDTWLSHN